MSETRLPREDGKRNQISAGETELLQVFEVCLLGGCFHLD